MKAKAKTPTLGKIHMIEDASAGYFFYDNEYNVFCKNGASLCGHDRAYYVTITKQRVNCKRCLKRLGK